MDVARLNFSHGTHPEHAQHIASVRNAARKHEKPIAILADLQGPKIRTGALRPRPAGTIAFRSAIFHHHEKCYRQREEGVSTTFKQLQPESVHKGGQILLKDGGNFAARSFHSRQADVICQVENAGCG